MSRRAPREEPPFGSDSFLDVLANIVGILIILIVTSAARVARMPAASHVASESIPETADSLPVASAAPGPEPLEQTAAIPSDPEPDSPPPEITEAMQKTAARQSMLDAKSRAAAAKLKELQSRLQADEKTLAEEQKAAAKRAGALRDSKLRLARLEEALGDRKHTLTAILAEFEEAKNTRPPAIEVKHRLAPISQEIAGDEVHFRIANGRVSVVPLSMMVERIKAQLERQKEWLAGRRRHESVVGPVDGYTMHYSIEQKSLSPLERNRLGYGAYRIGVTHWEIVPEPDLVGETVEEALRRGSKFALAVRTAPQRAALTFWVYPDSFPAYRALQAACHAEGFVVCARPLPDGVRIAGSPDGTRSAGQ